MIHVTDRFVELTAWYDRVFSTRHFADHLTEFFPYMEIERRDACLMTLGDTLVETMAPSFHASDWAEYPTGRFFQRFGSHWHSLAYYAPDIGALWTALESKGLRLFRHGGGPATVKPADAIFTHPRETFALIEFRIGPIPEDPRFLPGWDGRWWATHHPLGLERLAYATVVVSDAEAAVHAFIEKLGGRLLFSGYSAITATKNHYVSINADVVIELAEPTEQDSLAGKDLRENGSIVHAMTWRVRSLESARRHLEANGIHCLASDDRTLLADPSDTWGAPMRFTTWDVPDDPRGPITDHPASSEFRGG